MRAARRLTSHVLAISSARIFRPCSSWLKIQSCRLLSFRAAARGRLTFIVQFSALGSLSSRNFRGGRSALSPSLSRSSKASRRSTPPICSRMNLRRDVEPRARRNRCNADGAFLRVNQFLTVLAFASASRAMRFIACGSFPKSLWSADATASMNLSPSFVE